MTTVIENCVLEVDHARGVLYVHGPEGVTLLRVGMLPKPIPDPNIQLDIAHMCGASWRGETVLDQVEEAQTPIASALTAPELGSDNAPQVWADIIWAAVRAKKTDGSS